MSNQVYLGRLPSAGARVILPLGDSITFGTGSPNAAGYRWELFRLAASVGKPMQFVGNQTPTGPETIAGYAFPRGNAGYGGYKTTDIAGSIAVPNLTLYQPSIVLLHIGTNDIAPLDPTNIANAPVNLATLVDLIHSTAPSARVFLAKIIPHTAAQPEIITYNVAVGVVAAARSAWCTLVDMHAAFVANPSWATDYLVDAAHPNAAGYAVMAGVWHAAID